MVKDFKIVKKNGKYFLKSPECFINPDHEAIIYKADTDKPYIRYAGITATLEEGMIEALKAIL